MSCFVLGLAIGCYRLKQPSSCRRGALNGNIMDFSMLTGMKEGIFMSFGLATRLVDLFGRAMYSFTLFSVLKLQRQAD